jgi:hypothetical protein
MLLLLHLRGTIRQCDRHLPAIARSPLRNRLEILPKPMVTGDYLAFPCESERAWEFSRGSAQPSECGRADFSYPHRHKSGCRR